MHSRLSSGACRTHVCLLEVRFSFGVVGERVGGGREVSLYAVVGYEEEGSAGRGADERAANASVYTGEAAARDEAGGRLEAGFERVEGVEG
jgi:hypothetical protein